MVAAAFIGPGTVVTCSLAGAHHGYALLWALLFSIITTIVLQEMAGRLGIVRQISLGGAIRSGFLDKRLKPIISILVIIAIAVGNAAYQSGNITGASIGASSLMGSDDNAKLIMIISLSLIAFVLLFLGKYRVLEKTLIALVMLMSVSFLLTVTQLSIDFGAVFFGLINPTVPKGSMISIIALIGTTVVPYNLFLHSAAVSERWNNPDDVSVMRTDTVISVVIGGIISIMIVLTSAATLNVTGTQVNSIGDLSGQLSPLLGDFSSVLFSLGILAAGFTSVITAPLATAYAVSGILSEKPDMKSFWFRFSWMFVLLSGVIVASLGIKPLILIQTAQAANGLLLPVIGIFLLMVMNNSSLGKHKNGLISNFLGILVIVVITFLGIRTLLNVLI